MSNRTYVKIHKVLYNLQTRSNSTHVRTNFFFFISMFRIYHCLTFRAKRDTVYILGGCVARSMTTRTKQRRVRVKHARFGSSSPGWRTRWNSSRDFSPARAVQNSRGPWFDAMDRGTILVLVPILRRCEIIIDRCCTFEKYFGACKIEFREKINGTGRERIVTLEPIYTVSMMRVKN